MRTTRFLTPLAQTHRNEEDVRMKGLFWRSTYPFYWLLAPVNIHCCHRILIPPNVNAPSSGPAHFAAAHSSTWSGLTAIVFVGQLAVSKANKRVHHESQKSARDHPDIPSVCWNDISVCVRFPVRTSPR